MSAITNLFRTPRQPTPTDPTQVIAAQNASNAGSAALSNNYNRPDEMINQFDTRSNWYQTGTDPRGNPTFGQRTTLGGQTQDYLGGMQALGNQYAGRVDDFIGGRPDMSSNAAFDQADQFWQQREEPRLQRQADAERTRLSNLGFAADSEGHQSAMDDLTRRQSDARAGFLNSAQNQFFNQGLADRGQQASEYQLYSPALGVSNTALTAGQQPFSPINVGTTNAAGVYQNYDQQQMAAYNA